MLLSQEKIIYLILFYKLYYFQQWEVKAPMPSQAMRSAVKQITKLHESLSAVLPGAHVEASCSQNSNISLLLNYFT